MIQPAIEKKPPQLVLREIHTTRVAMFCDWCCIYGKGVFQNKGYKSPLQHITTDRHNPLAIIHIYSSFIKERNVEKENSLVYSCITTNKQTTSI